MNLNEILDPIKTGENSYDDEEMTKLYETARYYLSKMSETQREDNGVAPHTAESSIEIRAPRPGKAFISSY
jgi:hypothetical protein